MATQQILFAETIAGMKKAFKRKAYESDSDSEIEAHSNRGHKLKKRARFARKGQLVPTGGPSSYKEAIDYAGVRRSIIYRNPPLVDDEGYEIDSEDDDGRVREAMIAAAELNPYSNIRLERILAPLTVSTDLPTHPTLSKPFTSKTLTDLVSQSSRIMQKENQSLWQVRHLWTALCGDGNWVPCENMIAPHDIELFQNDQVYKDHYMAVHPSSLGKADGGEASSPATVNGKVSGEHAEQANKVSDEPDVSMMDAAADDEDAASAKTSKSKGADGKNNNNKKSPSHEEEAKSTKGSDGSLKQNSDTQGAASDLQVDGQPANDAPQEPETNGNPDPTATSEALEDTFIHPMFLPPPDAKPDRNLGLPDNEAEDIRRLLALYVQKQEEVCRGAKKLHHGLLRAERLRADVLHWSKAEAHCGPNRDMSDGEDWYDKEEWGLDEDLKKGQDEEEEDTTTTGKKTRARR